MSATTVDQGTPRQGARKMTSGSLPRWAPWGVYGSAALIAVILSLVTDWNVALLAIVAAAAAGVVMYAWARSVEGARRAKDKVVTLLVFSAFGVAVTPLVSLVYTVVDRGIVRFDGEFFTSDMRNVVGAGGGIYHALVGTIVITGLCALISVPIGIMCAIYLHEYGRGALKNGITFFVDVMTGIPSIVAGLFAFALFEIIYGPGIRLGIMGSVALCVLMIPIVVRSTEEMLKIVPNSLREASYALGVPKWRTIVSVVLPTALAGIITGTMVAIARVMGETAPLLITTGIVSTTNWNPFDGRMANLPVFSYTSYQTPGVPPDPYYDRAWASALLLIVLVMALNLIARFFYRKFGTHQR
jgi:phosphate transport system permease protein